MKKLFLVLSVLMALTLVTTVSAQVTYPNGTYTSYQVANLGAETNILVTYYDEDGVASPFTETFSNVPAGGVVTVQQALEAGLAAGSYSAVISAGSPVAAIANQQLGVEGSGSSIPPFSSYSAYSVGATSVTLPVIMYNWWGYYTEFYIQNISETPATDIEVEYIPTTLGSCVVGATGQIKPIATVADPLAKYASRKVSNFDATYLGGPGGAGCTGYAGRFLGMAVITADQPIGVVVNEIVQDKLFTYNGFTDASMTLLAPAYMRNYWNYYASLTIANPDPVNDANVTLYYEPGVGSSPSIPVEATHTIPAGESITIYDGPGSTGTDLSTDYDLPTEKFFGSVKIVSSDYPVIAMVNQEATTTAGKQAGSYNAFRLEEGGADYSVPLVQSAFYNYYTSITIMTVDGGEATVDITYTSDGTYSTVKNQSKTYTLSTTNGFLNRYEGATASADQSDLLDDPFWVGDGGLRRFIGSATIHVVSGSDIVVFVNSEYAKKVSDPLRDSMYTFNAFPYIPLP
ncbi:MAG: hypothetical protein LUQ65_15115 [Candidatus Helarchaeota archaeon]|nr:hypothetical protein [Candidatus Helarchaeota archaeon]